MRIPASLREFLESGVSILIGTRDARLRPSSTAGKGVRVEEDGDALTVFVPQATCAATLANLGDNGRIAVCFTRPQDDRAVQIKGRALGWDDAADADRELVDRYREAFARQLAWVGVPTAITMRMAHWPCVAVRVEPETLFVQTPGPGAGEPVAADAEPGVPHR